MAVTIQLDELERSIGWWAVERAPTKATDVHTIVQQVLDQTLDATLISAELDPVFQERVEEWGQRELDELGVGVAFNVRDPTVMEFLDQVSSTRIKGFNETGRRIMRRVLVDGIQEGEGIEDLSRRITETFTGMERGRARVIGRTETGRAANFTTWQAHGASGVVDKRRWISTLDDRVRVSHAEANGQVRGIKEEFLINGWPTMYPGNTGLPEEDINCRCTTVADIAGEGRGLSEARLRALWKRFDRRLIPWERQSTRAIRRGLRAQRDALLAEVDRLVS